MVMSLALISAIRWKKRSSKAMRRGRGSKRHKGDNLVVPEIPLDLQIEILDKMPAKSLMRFKCVSKVWYSLIRCRDFSNRYLNRARPPARLYMSLVDHIECDSMEVCHSPRDSVLLSLSLSSSSSSSSSNSSAKSFEQDLTMPGMGGRNMVVLRGLMLYIVCGKACIYNPTTRQSVTLPAVKSNIFAKKGFPRRRVLYFLGYDPVLDQYKVVCTVVIYSKKFERMTSEHWVFVLEAGGSWKRIEIDLPPHFPVRLGLCINGVIYYLASTCNSRDIVVSFDVRSEEFTNVQAPPHVVPAYRELVGFIEYGGKPAIFDHTNLVENGLVDLWVLEDAGKWSRTSLVLQPCQLHLLDNDHDIHFLTVEGTTQNGEVILAVGPLLSPCYILYYHLHNNDLRKVRIRGIPDYWFRKPRINLLYVKLMDETESIMHLEI